MRACCSRRRRGGSGSGRPSSASASADRQRLEKAYEVIDLLAAEVQRFQDFFTVGMNSFKIQLRVEHHDLLESRDAAVVHVRRGASRFAQRRHAELAEVAVLRVDMARAGRALP